jgi:hypothetical protein
MDDRPRTAREFLQEFAEEKIAEVVGDEEWCECDEPEPQPEFDPEAEDPDEAELLGTRCANCDGWLSVG